MSNAVVPRQRGDTFQSYFFWYQAFTLYIPNSNAVQIDWEADDTAGFDDVVVHYNPPKLDSENGSEIHHTAYQVKFHVDHSRQFTCEALTDPAFIGTENESVLKRLFKLYEADTDKYRKSRFHLVNTWGIDKKDPLNRLVGNGGAIIISRLFNDKTDRSAMGKIRKLWREHIGITDEELKQVLISLRIDHSFSDLEKITTPLNYYLTAAGFKPIPLDQRANGYTELIQRLHAEGKKSFTKDELMVICQREGLLLEEKPNANQTHLRIGLRSFIRGAENLHGEVDKILCFLDRFSGRFLIDLEQGWSEVAPLVAAFAEEVVMQKNPVLLHLDTHLSLSFCFGYFIGSKSGIDISIIQKTALGRTIWQLTADGDSSDGNMAFQETINDDEKSDIVIAVSITHNIYSDVVGYVNQTLNNVNRVIHAMVPVPSNNAIKNANHILSCVQETISQIRQIRASMAKKGQVHLFIAGPNAFAFFLGQYSKLLGKITVYEYDFEQTNSGTYSPSITLPI